MKSAAATAALLLATLFAVAPRAQEQPVFRARTDLVLLGPRRDREQDGEQQAGGRRGGLHDPAFAAR